MMGRTHLAAGAAGGMIAAAISGTPWLPCLLAGMAGGLLPDLDTPTSSLGRKTRPLSNLMCKLFGHRGGTHSLLFMMAVALGGGLISDEVGFAAALGVLSHILTDAISFSGQKPYLSIRGAGVPIAWPVSSRKIGIRLIRLGGPVERLLVAPGSIVLAALFARGSGL